MKTGDERPRKGCKERLLPNELEAGDPFRTLGHTQTAAEQCPMAGVEMTGTEAVKGGTSIQMCRHALNGNLIRCV